MEKIFVYGTLRPGFWNYDKVLKNRVKHQEKAAIRGEVFHLPEGYPAVIEGNEWVYGELLTITQDKILKSIDFLEGYFGEGEDNLYIRKKVEVRVKDKVETGWAYIYVNADYAKKRGKKVGSGDWATFMKNKEKRF